MSTRFLITVTACLMAFSIAGCTRTESRLAGAGAGAAAGAVILGPVGAAIGGVTGAVAGPSLRRNR